MDEPGARLGGFSSRLEQSHAARSWREQSARPEVAVFGECNTANLGDRAIHREALFFFAECGWRTSSYSLGSLAPAKTEAGGRKGPPVTSRLKSVALDRVPRVKCALREVRQRYNMQRLLPRLAQVQAISVSGGAVLSDLNLHFPQSLAMLTKAGRLLDKPLLCLGCSAEGSWSARGEEKIREFLAACSVVAARDEATAERIASVLCRPVPVFGDFCLTEARMRNDGRWQHPRHGLAINVCGIPAPWHAAQQRYEDALVALANRLTRSMAERSPQPIRIFTTGTAEDAIPAQRVFARLAGDGVELHRPHSLDELTMVLRGSAMVIASRLHGAILALAEQAPVIGLSPSPKLRNFLSTMDLGEYSFTVDDGARLIRWLERTDYGSIRTAQRRALLHAPVWPGRMQVREALESIAGALSRSKIECT
jgi:polysaccharide pyruvyl transferase WcaK-like protein